MRCIRRRMIVTNRLSALVALFLMFGFSGCGGASQTSVSGQPDQWVRGKSLSIRISFTEGKIGIRNDNGKEARVIPMTVRGWYKTFGQKEITMRSGQIEVLKPGEQLALSIPPFLQMEPPPGGLFTEEALDKLQVELGPPGAREVFTVQAKP